MLHPPAASRPPVVVRSRRTALVAAAALAASLLATGGVGARPAAAAPSACADVEVVVARGTGEAPGLGVVGRSFARELAAALPGRTTTTRAVAYSAEQTRESVEQGAADLAAHVERRIDECPGTRFVVSGMSLGAAVVSLAAARASGRQGGRAVPAADADRVAAVVVFGNPLGSLGLSLDELVPELEGRSRDYCATLDDVCGRYEPALPGGHASYVSGGATREGAAFAAALVDGVAAATPGRAPAR
ncbi:cutinase family protein [uncultured Pseudokineococcus sp.]|uniref:cutinase family protein n=1 Tax=uncultured Pseudokineococcus sp. TaxID=1642928 RepID=UPI0026123EBE|nr:cutinase family protein [uncultured Pseudokineococcus sp.]